MPRCDVALRLEIASDGSVADVSLLRQDENETCNETLVAYVRKTRWSPAPDVARRTMSMGWSNDPKPRGGGESDEAEFRTYPGGMGLDSDRYFLLAHRDPSVDLALLGGRYSRLGPFERIEEVRSDSPLLCAIGRDSDETVVFRSMALESPQQLGDENAFGHAAVAWPDLELLGAHAHLTAGSCFLLWGTAQTLPPS